MNTPPSRSGRLAAETSIIARADGADSRTVRFVAATEKRANDGGVIEVRGWQLDRYLGNPIVLWAHDSKEPPIGKATKVERTADGLVIDVEFPTADVYPRGDTFYKLIREGFIRSCSVGFRVLEERDPTSQERAAGTRWVATKTELLELSIVPVGSDQGAKVMDGKRLAEVFTRADVSVLKSLAGVEPWDDVTRAVEAALAVPATTTTSSSSVGSIVARLDPSHDHAACEELHDLLTRAMELLVGMHAAESAPREHKTESKPVESPQTRTVAPAGDVGATRSEASSKAIERILGLLEGNQPCQIPQQ